MSKAQHQMAKKGKMENLNPTTSSSQNHFIIVLQSLVENCEKKCRFFMVAKSSTLYVLLFQIYVMMVDFQDGKCRYHFRHGLVDS